MLDASTAPRLVGSARRLLPSITLSALLLLCAARAQADESKPSASTPPPVRTRKPIGGAFAIEPASATRSRDGASTVEFLPMDILLYIPREQHWDAYVGVGMSPFGGPMMSFRIRAGVHWLPRGRTELGPVFGVGVLGIGGAGLRPPKALRVPDGEDPPLWFYTGALGQLSAGLRIPRDNGASYDILPTFLFGSLSYRTDGQPEGLPNKGEALFYGGTVSVIYEW